MNILLFWTPHAGENCVTCIHCNFFKEKVIPNLETQENESSTRMLCFVNEAKAFNGKNFVELYRKYGIRKYSTFTEGDDYAVFVYLSYNKRVGKYIASCTNGHCKSLKGHKRTVHSLLTADLCKHLNILKLNNDCWEDLINASNEEVSYTIESNDIDNEEYFSNEHLSDNTEDNHFNEMTGLWEFKCKSSHSPSSKDSQLLRLNVQKRDLWNDSNLERLADGCLKGPHFMPSIPADTCSCGAGWMKGEDEDFYDVNGLIVHEKNRALTVYTQIAPVKCYVYSRLCYNKTNPCKLMWNEGQLDSLHVLSRDTAAGDELGHEFVSSVINSGCTFTSI